MILKYVPRGCREQACISLSSTIQDLVGFPDSRDEWSEMTGFEGFNFVMTNQKLSCDVYYKLDPLTIHFASDPSVFLWLIDDILLSSGVGATLEILISSEIVFI